MAQATNDNAEPNSQNAEPQKRSFPDAVGARK